MTEHDIQNEIKAVVSKYGIIFRTNVGTVRTQDGRYFQTGLPNGFPDLFGIIRGMAIAIEVKRPGCSPTENQKHIHDVLRQNGAKVAVCHSAKEAEEFILKEVLQ